MSRHHSILTVLHMAILLTLVSVATAQENPLIVRATPGCSVKLAGAISGEYSCIVHASKSGEGVHLEISGPAPFDPTSPAQPLTFSFIANFMQLPKKGTYRDVDRDHGGPALYAKVVKTSGDAQNIFDSVSKGGTAELTVESCSPDDSAGIFFTMHGTAKGRSPLDDNSTEVVSMDVRF